MVADFAGELLRLGRQMIPDWIEWRIEMQPGKLGVTPEVASVTLICRLHGHSPEVTSVVHADKLEILDRVRNVQLAQNVIEDCQRQLSL